MGEPTKLVVLEKVVDIIKRDNLVETTKAVGDYLKQNLEGLVKEFPDKVQFSFCIKQFTCIC
jgi:4-aminobutyrate aminotransferase-like enzyme